MSIYVALDTKFECGQIIEKRYVVMRKPILDMSRILEASATETRFVEGRFDEALFFLRFIMEQVREPEISLPWVFPKLPQLDSIDHVLTQEQMRDICESIQQNTESICDYTVIDLGEECFVWNGQEFSLMNFSIRLRLFRYETIWRDLIEEDKANAMIFIRGGADVKKEAYLKIKGSDGNDCFFELREFSLLSFLAPPGDDYHAAGYVDEMSIEAMQKNRDNFLRRLSSVFVLFDKYKDFMFVKNTSLCLEALSLEMAMLGRV